MNQNEMTIGALARRMGVRTSALRYYEDIGLMRPARRVGGRRRYDETAVETLRVIQLAAQCGFTLAEIKVLMADFDSGEPSSRWVSMAQDKMRELDTQLGRLENMRTLLREGLECRCLDLKACALLTGSG